MARQTLVETFQRNVLDDPVGRLYKLTCTGARSEITYLWIKDPQKWSWINADQELSEYQYQEALTGNYLPIILMKAVWSISFSAITAMFTAADPASMQHW